MTFGFFHLVAGNEGIVFNVAALIIIFAYELLSERSHNWLEGYRCRGVLRVFVVIWIIISDSLIHTNFISNHHWEVLVGVLCNVSIAWVNAHHEVELVSCQWLGAVRFIRIDEALGQRCRSARIQRSLYPFSDSVSQPPVEGYPNDQADNSALHRGVAPGLIVLQCDFLRVIITTF